MINISFYSNYLIKRRLHNNKIECNCNILWLSKLLLKNTHLAHEAKCFTRERAAYKEIISLKDDDFDCSSQGIYRLYEIWYYLTKSF